MAVRFLPLDPSDPREIAGYALRARLGSGGMGNVYLSFTRGGRPVAIKVVRREFADDPEFRRRFRQEVTAAQRVQGQFTAPVLDADTDAPVPWLATAYIAGPSLAQAVAEHGAFPIFAVCRLLGGVAEGLSSVHGAGLVHRDLKPANVLLAEDGPRVIDFGIAHAADASSITGTGVLIGTPAFMAPEQVTGRPVTPATDVFALAHLVFYAAAGHTVFGEGHHSALVYRIANEEPSLDDCPGQLRPILTRCLARDPQARPDLTEVMEFARQQLSGQTFGLVGASWLPDPVAGTLAAFRTSAAPPPAAAPAAAPASASPGAHPGSAQPGSPPVPGAHPSFPSVPGTAPAAAAVPRSGQAAQPAGPTRPPGYPQPPGNSPRGGFWPGGASGGPGGPGGVPRPPGRGPWRPRVVLPAAALALVIGGVAYLLGSAGGGSPVQSPSAPASRGAGAAAGQGAGAATTAAPPAQRSASSGTPPASAPAAVSHATYSTSEPFPICDPNGARWKPVNLIPGGCGQDMQPTSGTAGYNFETVTAFPRGIAVTAGNTVTLTGTPDNGIAECLGPAEGNASAGYVALLCSDGTWSVNAVSGLGSDSPVVGKQVAAGSFPYDNSKSYDASLMFGSGTGKLTITFTQGSASPLSQSFSTGQFTPTVVGYAAHGDYGNNTIGTIGGFVYKS